MAEVMDLSKIVQVVECGHRKADLFLEHGYVLLGVHPVTFLQEYPKDSEMPDSHFIRKSIHYSVGRTEDIDEYTPPGYSGP